MGSPALCKDSITSIPSRGATERRQICPSQALIGSIFLIFFQKSFDSYSLRSVRSKSFSVSSRHKLSHREATEISGPSSLKAAIF